MTQPNTSYLTPEGKAKVQAELEELVNIKRPALAKRLREAIQQGDLSENADYHVAKEDQAFLEGRILELEQVLRQAIIIEESGPTETVQMGSRVTVQEDGEDMICAYRRHAGDNKQARVGVTLTRLFLERRGVFL